MKRKLVRKQWVCPESGELSDCARILREERDSFDSAVMEKLPKAFAETLISLTELRHTAVHRRRSVPLNRVLGFVSNAKALSELCENRGSYDELRQIMNELEEGFGQTGSTGNDAWARFQKVIHAA